ncbi:MAG: type VI secretion system tip protein VgrG [Deltaproteobacteria bacterium]|nr:type VI secretion system tip protein VgrG [Deltaproteobacteria bacterium]
MSDPRVTHEPVQWRVELRTIAGESSTFATTVRRVRITEELARPYAIELELLVDHTVELEDLLGAHVELTLGRESDIRTMFGVVRQAAVLGSTREGLVLGLSVGPACALLDVGRRSRIFQGMSVPQIVQAIVAPTFERTQRKIDVAKLGEHPVHDYCVQYRESDLAFIHRLLEDEGITAHFFHDQAAGAEVLQLIDEGRSFAFADVPDTLQLRAPDQQGGMLELETVHAFADHAEPRPQRVRYLEQRWRAGDDDVIYAEIGDHDPPTYESFEHGVFAAVDEDDPAVGPDRTPWRAELELQRDILRGRHAHGASTVVGLAVGQVVELGGMANPASDASWLVTRVDHRMTQPERDGGATHHENHFSCVPATAVFRPRRRGHKPRISGVHTATVVGPEGEEIHVDEHGRIRVRMHWDQHAKDRGDGSAPSCWVRVAQSMAGPGFGTVFLPRIGMEVVITFIDGDVDRPLCTGCVYNGRNQPPRALPDDKTRTVLKTRSTPDSDGFNELSFEDAAGHEQIYLHAQRNLDEVVLASSTRSVGVDETEKVGRDRGTTSDRHETIHVDGDRGRSVGGNESLEIAGSLRTVIQGGAGKGGDVQAPGIPGAELSVQGTYAITVRDEIKIVCGASSIVMKPDSVVVNTPKLQLMGADASLLLQPGEATMFGTTTTLTSAASGLKLDAGALLNSSTQVRAQVMDSRLTLDGTARLRAPSTTIEGVTALMLESATCVSVDGGVVDVTGKATVTVSSVGQVMIDGGGATATFAMGMAQICE